MAPGASPHRQQWLALGLLGLLCLGVIAVFLWLPRWVSPTVPTGDPATVTESAIALAATTPEPDPAPLLPEPPEARAEAQSALAALLPQFEALRTQRLATWDPDMQKKLEATIAEGEQAYREQRFTAARQAYARAAADIAATSARIPDVIAEYLDAGERALRSQDPRAAETAFSLALALAPDNADAQRGLARATAFDKVVALLTEAKDFERVGAADRAAEAYQEALKLDPEATEARQSLARIANARAEAAFTAQMSQGFTALQRGEFAQAESAFKAATRQRPASREAANALAQTRARATAARIDAALAAARQAERQEQWKEAGAQYRAALALDSAIDAAVQGNARAAGRARLDERFQALSGQPERLRDGAVADAATDLLREARAIPQPGPRLTAQINALQAALSAARTPVEVTIGSDGATDVTILKVGKLGRLTVQKITLYPGRYTALGTRDGYRDARVEFTVAAESPAPSITIQCREALPFGR